MPGQKREARLRARCPGHPRPSEVAASKTWMAGHRRAEATPSFGRLCPAMTWRGCAATRTSAALRSRRLRLRILDRAPDPLGGQRHIDMRDAEFGERIEHRVDDG